MRTETYHFSVENTKTFIQCSMFYRLDMRIVHMCILGKYERAYISVFSFDYYKLQAYGSILLYSHISDDE